MRAVGLVVLAGCWGEAAIDISGTYHVASIVESACADDVPVAGIAYLDIYSAPGGYAVDGCADAAAMSCARFTLLDDPIDDEGWGSTQATAVINGDLATCDLTFSVLTALLSDTTLSIEHTIYIDTIDSGSPACTDAEARKRGDAMACNKHQVLVATQLTIQP